MKKSDYLNGKYTISDQDNGRIRPNAEFFKLFNKLYLLREIAVMIVRWGHLFRTC